MKKFIRFVMPILVVVGAVFIAVLLIKSRKPPAKQVLPEAEIQVEVMATHRGATTLVIQVAGTVLPARQIELRAQVAGKIVAVSENLQPGGRLTEGEMILRIDDRDYQFAVRRREAELERARFELQTEKGRGVVAEREWQLLGKELESSEMGKELSLRIPHLRRAEANYAAAESSLEEARLNLSRTELTAPFNARVRLENVDLGQVVNTQTPIATLTGTDRYWVQAAVSVDQLAHLVIPKEDGSDASEVVIIHASGDTSIKRRGKILRLLSDLEQSGRLARLLIAVDDPLGLKNPDQTLPLLLNAYVRVEIAGKTLRDVCQVPPHTLREGNKVWVVNRENRLDIREVEVLWQERERVLIGKGLADGERVVVSSIATPVPGMKLNVVQAETTAARGGSGD